LFADDVRTTNVFTVGGHGVTLAVSDGTTLGRTTVRFDVINLSEATAAISHEIDRSGIKRKDERPLLSELQAAMGSFDRGKIQSGVDHLLAFQKKVGQSFGNTPDALSWIRAAQQIIDAVGQ